MTINSSKILEKMLVFQYDSLVEQLGCRVELLDGALWVSSRSAGPNKWESSQVQR